MREKSPYPALARFASCAIIALVIYFLQITMALGQTTTEYMTMAGESLERADSYLKNGQPEKTIDIYQKVLRHFPGAPILHTEIAKIYASIEKWKKALKHTRIAHKLAPLDHNIAFEYGKLLIITGDPKDAVPVFQKLLDADPAYPGAEDELLKAAMGSKDWKVAIPIAKKLVEENPDNIKAREDLANSYFGTKEWELTIDENKSILAMDPENQRAMWHLAKAYRDAGQLGEAHETLEKYVEKYPKDRDGKWAIRHFNAWASKRSRTRAPSFISTTNPSIARMRGLTVFQTYSTSMQQLTYDFYWQRKRNKKTGERSTSIFHDAEFITGLNEKLALNLDLSFRQDDNNSGATPIIGWGLQYNWSDALNFQPTVGFEPNRGSNPQLIFPLELVWYPADDLEFRIYDTITRYWDSNFSNSANIQGTYFAHRFMKGLRFRLGGYHDMIERPSPYFSTIDGHAKPLMLWTGQFDVEKDLQLPFGILLTCGYSFGYNSNNTKTHTGYGGFQRSVGENISLFGSFSGGIDSDHFEYLGAGAYGGINFKF